MDSANIVSFQIPDKTSRLEKYKRRNSDSDLFSQSQGLKSVISKITQNQRLEIEVWKSRRKSMNSFGILSDKQFILFPQTDSLKGYGQKLLEKQNSQLNELRLLGLDDFVLNYFNKVPDKRDLYEKIWFERYNGLMEGLEKPMGSLKKEKPIPVSSIRDGLVSLSQADDPKLCNVATLALIRILEESNHEPDTAHGLVGLAKSLGESLALDKADELTIKEQRLKIRAYALVIQLILLHYSFSHLNAVRQSVKNQIWDRVNDLSALNKLKDPEINYWVFFAMQGAQRLKTNQGKLKGVLGRLSGLFTAGVEVVDIAINHENIATHLDEAFKGLEKVFYHAGDRDESYDKLVVLKKLIKVVGENKKLFSRVKRIVHSTKSNQGFVCDELLYGTVELLRCTVHNTKDKYIREEALKLILQFITIKRPKIHCKVIRVLNDEMVGHHDQNFRLTIRVILDILIASRKVKLSKDSELLKEVTRKTAPILKNNKEPIKIYNNVVRFLLYRVAEIKDEGYRGNSLLNLLASSKNEHLGRLIETLYKQLGRNAIKPDKSGNTPYHLATNHCNQKMLEILHDIEKRTGKHSQKKDLVINFSNQRRETPLHLCAVHGTYKICHTLLEFGAHPNCVDNQGNTPLSLAIDNEQLKMIDLLMAHDAKVSERNRCETVFLYAVQNKKEKVLMYLLNLADVKISAIEAFAIYKMIIKDRKLNCSQEFSKFHYKKMQLDPAYKKLFAMFPCRIQVSKKKSKRILVDCNETYPPLIDAIRKGNFERARFILSGEKDSKVIQRMKDDMLNGPLHHAMSLDPGIDKEFIDLLINFGVDINSQNLLGLTPMHLSVMHEKTHLLKSLLFSKAETNIGDVSGFTPLHFAAYFRNKRMVDLLLKYGADPKMESLRKLTPLHMVVSNKRLSDFPSFALKTEVKRKKKFALCVVQNLLKAGSVLDGIDDNGNNVLHLAAHGGYSNIIEFLYKKDNQLFWGKNSFGNFPIHEAFQNNKEKIVLKMFDFFEDLIKLSEEFNMKTSGRQNLFSIAAECGMKDVLVRFVEKKQKILEQRDTIRHRRCALHIACLNGHESIVELCLKEKVDFSIRDKHQQTPLHLAVLGGNRQIVERLIKAGADVMAKNEKGFTPLHEGAFVGTLQILKQLVNAGSVVNATDNMGNTPIHLAAREGHLEVLQYFIEEANGNIHKTNDNQNTALHKACNQGQEEIVKYLLLKKARVNVENVKGLKPLHLSAQFGELKILSYLLASGAYIKAKDDEEETALHKAVMWGHLEVVKKLINYDGIQIYPGIVNAKNNYGETPLHKLVKRNLNNKSIRIAIFKLLYESGACMNIIDDNGLNVLHLIAQCGDEPLLNFIIKYCNKEIKPMLASSDSKDNTPLHYACERGKVDIVKKLLNAGSKIDKANKKGDTPLLSAVRHGQIRVVEKLINSGCSKRQSNKKHQNAMHLAIQNSNLEMAEVLVNHCPALITMCDEKKNTSLHYTAKYNCFKIASLLLSHLKKKQQIQLIGKENKAGLRAVDVAEKKSHIDYVCSISKYHEYRRKLMKTL